MEFGLGQFGDCRLEKGGPICMRLWWIGRGRAFDDLPAIEPRKFDSPASFAMRM